MKHAFQQLLGTKIFWLKTNAYICDTHSCFLSVRKYSNFFPGNSRLEWFSQMSTLSNSNDLDETRTMSNNLTFSISFKVLLLLTPWQMSLIDIPNVLSAALFHIFVRWLSPYKIVSSFSLQHLVNLFNRLPATRCIYNQIKSCHSPGDDHLGQGTLWKSKVRVRY